MRILPGIAASPGVAIGEALIIDHEGFRIPRRYVARDAVEQEIQRLDHALTTVAAEMERHRDAISRQLGDQYGAIFSAHAQMLRDPGLYQEVTGLIRDDYFSTEFAVSKTIQRYAQVFQQASGSYLAERAHDLYDLERNLLRHLLGERRELLANLSSPVVLLAYDLTPSDTATLDRRLVLGFATEIGGAGGHTAIVAKGLEIPAAVGIGGLLGDVTGGDVVIVDGDHGRVILRPDEETLAHYRREHEAHLFRALNLTRLRDVPAETADGCRIFLFANVEFPREAQACLERGADGVGLYRTEFLYLSSLVEPTEEQHFQAYSEVVRAMEDRPVVIRTQDLGADKMGQQPLLDTERNPCLGLRSIRLSLRNVSGFRTQLRAILRASALGQVKIMFPLISTLSELRQAKTILADAMEDLDETGQPYNRNIEVGIMVEVPSVVVMLDKFLPEVSFLSIGTNDLIQYALAVDRGNTEVADRYQASDPAVLRMLHMTLRAGHEASVPVNVCGQMSGEPLYTTLLLGLGLRGLSVPPAVIPEIKKICRSVTLPQCEQIAQRALQMESAREIDRFLREELRKVAPELVDTEGGP
jgi:phosphotransferase system enzyme I (PtsI)